MNNIFVNICDIWKHAPGTKFTIDGELYLYIGRTTEEPSIKMYQYSTNLIRYEEEFAEDSSFELYDAAPEVRSLAIIHLQEILRLIDDGIKEARCECCKLSEWMGKPIPLELHHKDGNHYNNDLSNLEILCPNCHAQTDNYSRRG